MEVVLDAQTITQQIEALHQVAPGSIGDQFAFELLSCDSSRGAYVFRCKTASWMRNGPGTLHGGIGSAVLDQAMGLIAFCTNMKNGIAPTIQMQTVFHKPLMPGTNILVHVYQVSAGKNLLSFRAEAFSESDPESLCLSGTAVYYCKSITKSV